ncbi:hypothetical protein B0I37DRAFT_383875 [Chaetomium sp. MPI-CAGE-AT-0009]|nr:hypothetical protein B0I37DRAFT_383875 [Chaetomium sp. MPI-CAGE-AT-0009]
MAVAVVPPPPRTSKASRVVPVSNTSTAVAIIPPPPRASASATVIPPSASSTTSTVTNIHPAEQRRLATIQGRNLNRIDQRIEREGKASISAAEAERRLGRLRSQTSLAHHMALARAPSTTDLFQNACASDILFLIDTTYSMDPYLEAVKTQVTSIVRDLSAAFFHKATLRLAVVSYKDHGDNPHIQSLDFTSKTDKVFSFLASLYTSGGGDAPEDVLGALQMALSTSWKNQTRCIIHIADAPPHGRTLHDMKDSHDNYAEPGTEPHQLTHPPIIQQMISQNINYTLLRINHSTDRMAWVFSQAYAASSADCRLLESNKYAESRGVSYSSKAGFQGWTMADQRATTNLKFAELKLGTSYHSLRDLVVNFVTTSVTNSATFSSVAASSLRSEIGAGGRFPSNCAPSSRFGFNGFASGGGPFGRGSRSISSTTIKASSSPPPLSMDLETMPPQWDTPGWLNEEIQFAAYSTEVLAHDDSMLDRMMDSPENIGISTTNLTVAMRDKPFAKGAMRLASYARSGSSRNQLVVKTYMREGTTLLHLMEDMRAQALCKAFALEFNAMLPEQHSLDFIVVTGLERASESGKADGKCMSLEPRIEGQYVKYNSNQGWVNETNLDDPVFQATQAFSHFTFERSRGHFMVTDLQGVGRVLTDPALQTLDPNYLPLASGNVSLAGFHFFFLTHKCNSVCKQLNLLSHHDMLTTGNYKFREDWPTQREVANMLVCCSNKLCSRIVRMSKAKTSDDFPGYRWCRNCWPELESTTVKVVCTAPGHPHDFKLSRFFYESQGQILPRHCPKHREGDGSGTAATAPTTAATSATGSDIITCKFGAGCTNMECPFLHPAPPCKSGKACERSDCTLRHAVENCRYGDKCGNTECVFRHPGGHPARSRGASSFRTAVRSSPRDCRYGGDCTNRDCAFEHPVSICKRGSDCAVDGCGRRHPKGLTKCRYGANCIEPKCVYEHPSHK